jgi:hypothetical protein
MHLKPKFLAAYSIIVTAVLLFFIAFIPLNPTKANEERALQLISTALISNGSMDFYSGDKLEDLGFISKAKKMYITGLPQKILSDLQGNDPRIIGATLESLPKEQDWNKFFADGNIIIRFNTGGDGVYYFSYTFGTLGGQGYKYLIRRTLLFTKIIISHEWIS